MLRGEGRWGAFGGVVGRLAVDDSQAGLAEKLQSHVAVYPVEGVCVQT